MLTAGGTPDTGNPDFWSQDGNGIPWVAIGDMSTVDLVTATDRQITPAGAAAKGLTEQPAGTVLFAMYASVGAVSMLGVDATWNQALLGMQPRHGLCNERFLFYWLKHLSSDLSAITRTSTQENLNAEQVANLPFPDMSLADQIRIADYLDAVVARIDTAAQLRRDQLAALDERLETAVDAILSDLGWKAPQTLEAEALKPLPTGWRAARLSQVLRQLTNGYVGPTRDILVDDGVRYIQGMHIKEGAIDFDRRHFFVSADWHAARPRIHLRAGDVLVVQTGDIGKVAVVPPDFGEASCHALQILRVRPEIVSGEYLGTYLGSSFGYHSLLSRATGALHPHLEGGIRSVPVVIPPLEVQAKIIEEAAKVRETIRLAQAAMREQLALLDERKRSLITSAVQREFDFSAASGRGTF